MFPTHHVTTKREAIGECYTKAACHDAIIATAARLSGGEQQTAHAIQLPREEFGSIRIEF